MAEPKILFFDLELTPNRGYTWGKWEQNVIRFDKEFELLSFAYKYLGQKTVFCETRQNQKTDKKIVCSLRNIINESDIIVGHNSDQFDIKKLNARLVFHGERPLKNISSVDTKKVARRHFAFNSNSLDDLGNYLGLGRKMKHQGIDLWFKCMEDDRSAWKEMVEYNKQDIVLLEKVYLKLLPHMHSHPNIARLKDDIGCDKCGGTSATKHGVRPGPSGIRQRWLCHDCGGYFCLPIKKPIELK